MINARQKKVNKSGNNNNNFFARQQRNKRAKINKAIVVSQIMFDNQILLQQKDKI